jgi:hypothetical protein
VVPGERHTDGEHEGWITDTTGVQTYPSDPYRRLSVEVRGARIDRMERYVRRLAAQFLQEEEEFLYVSRYGEARAVEFQRFVPHLGVQRKPTRWSLLFTVSIDPGIVRERRRVRGIPDPDDGSSTSGV